MKLLHVQKGKQVKSGQSSKKRMDMKRFVLVLGKMTVKLVLHGHSVPVQPLILAKSFCVHGSSMRLFKQEELLKPRKNSNNDMLNVLVLKVLFHKEPELLIFVPPAIVDWIKPISNMFSLLLP